ncbi:MAG: hypothetical protein HXS44_09220 [Theionarchaea archaeon]|nr:hypothetical protein [Theionarchaea archaeon]
MKKGLALCIIVTLLITLCDIPVFSEPAPDEYVVYREYREDLLRLQEETARVYLELHQEKNPQAVYEHVLQVIHQTAVLLGDTEAASMDIDYDLQPSLQNYMEMLLLLGLNEEKMAHLMDLGYTEEDIVKFMDWILTYNDFNHHAMTGFTPEEMERFYSAGLTDAHIADLQAFINDYYASPHTVQEGVNQEKGLQHIQISLSLIALKILEENHVKNKEKDTDRLQNAEGNLAVAIQNISDKPSLEKVKAYSKEVYKAAEQKIRNGEHQYRVDFFVGLQIYCGSLTALHGDRECGLAQIHVYGNVVSECALSPERPILEPVPSGEYEALVEQSSPFRDYIGLVEESNEANNMGVTVAFVKAPDTTFMQFLLLLFAGVGAEIWSNWTLPGLTVSLESLCAGGSTTISTWGMARCCTRLYSRGRDNYHC